MIGAGLLVCAFDAAQIAIQSARIEPTPTRDPLIPTRTLVSASATRAQVILTPTPSATPAATPGKPSLLWQGKPRWGIGVANGPITRYDLSAFSFGWFLDWGAQRKPAKVSGAEYAQMIRIKKGVLYPSSDAIKEIARQNPGSLWFVGNEPSGSVM
jgi:hypothetical protein